MLYLLLVFASILVTAKAVHWFGADIDNMALRWGLWLGGWTGILVSLPLAYINLVVLAFWGDDSLSLVVFVAVLGAGAAFGLGIGGLVGWTVSGIAQRIPPPATTKHPRLRRARSNKRTRRDRAART
jgi:hypothetical protein